jgi:hypothetical protein
MLLLFIVYVSLMMLFVVSVLMTVPSPIVMLFIDYVLTDSVFMFDVSTVSLLVIRLLVFV